MSQQESVAGRYITGTKTHTLLLNSQDLSELKSRCKLSGVTEDAS